MKPKTQIRPSDLKSYLERAQKESEHIHAYALQLTVYFAETAKLEFPKYDEAVQTIQTNEHESNIAFRHRVYEYLRLLKRAVEGANRIKKSLRIHQENIRILISWMNRYDPTIYQFKSRLRNTEFNHELAQQLQQRVIKFTQICDRQVALIEGTLKALSEATHRGKPYDEKARFKLIEDNIEALNLLAFPAE